MRYLGDLRGSTVLIFMVACTASWSVLGANNGKAQMGDFRVETDVFVPEEPKPIQQTLTLFKNGVAYDFSRDQPEMVSMFDPARKRTVLFDTTRKIQLEIDLEQFDAFMQSARNEISQEYERLLLNLEDAKAIDVSEDKKTVSVGEKVLRYEAKLEQPPVPAFAQQYAAFADASARLNASRAKSPPPFARTALNSAIAELQAMPKEIKRTTFVYSGDKVSEHVIKCRLHTNWRLSKDDDTQIAEVGRMLVNFEQVTPAVFYKKPAPGQLTAAGN